MAELIALADERRLPVLDPRRPGDPRAGAHAVELAGRYPNARLILAHAGISDLAWLWRVAPDHPNLLFDTAWWMPADMRALFSLVPPGQILFASDAPYGSTFIATAFMLRTALQVGLSTDQIHSIASGQALRIAAGEPLAPVGPAVGEREQAPHVLLDRVSEFVLLGAIATMRQADGADRDAGAGAHGMRRARRDRRRAGVRRDPRAAGLVRRGQGGADPDDRRPLSLLILAATAARTPDVPVPRLQAAAAQAS